MTLPLSQSELSEAVQNASIYRMRVLVFECQLFKKKTSVLQRRTLSKVKRGEWAQMIGIRDLNVLATVWNNANIQLELEKSDCKQLNLVLHTKMI